MSEGSSPPEQPPMMSPDGKWVWNGQKWIPVAVHESVFAAYSEATAAAATGEPAAPFAATMVSPPVNPFASTPSTSPFSGPPAAFPPIAAAPPPAVVSPAIVLPASYTSGGAAPPWQAWAAGRSDRSRMMYIAAAFIAVALGVILTIYFTLSQLPFLRASNEQPTATPSPIASPTPQLVVRSEYAIAGRYVTSTFDPDMAILGTPLFHVHEACNGTLALSCQQALTALDQVIPTSLAAFDSQTPPCIARQVAKVKADILGIQAGVKTGLKGFAENNRVELQHGLAQYNASNKPLQADIIAVRTAQAGTCDGQPEGP